VRRSLRPKDRDAAGRHPATLSGRVTDREVFHSGPGRIKFHLRFHDGSGAFDARSVVRLRRQGPDATCNDGDVLDLVIGELVREREQFLPPP
jgi:hypothetical protein